MAKRNDDITKNIKKVEKPLSRMQQLVSGMMNKVSNSDTYNRDEEIADLTKEIDKVVFQDMDNLTKFTGEDISTFLVKHFNDQEGQTQNISSIEDLFEGDSGGVFSFFKDRYQNRNLLYEDLNLISSQLYELQEALNATRDAVVTADELSQNVSRTIKFKNSSQEEADDESYIGVVKSMEKQFKILSKLKNHIVPNSLQYGSYYVYTVPYATLFQQFHEKKQKNMYKTGTVLESVDEGFVKDFAKDLDINGQNTAIKKSFSNVMENIEVWNDDVAIPLVEQTELTDLIEHKFEKHVEKAQRAAEKQQTNFTDGTVDAKAAKGKKKIEDFSNVKDCFVKLIDPRKIIPIKILDEVIGYYYIHEEEAKVSRSPFTTSIKLSPTQTDARSVETAFLTKITDKIVKAFDRSYLEKNVKFKELILNSLMYNDIYKKQLKFQFIPVDYITEFKVNPDEEGNGTSILLPSLFYAKLYLALLIFKMVTIIGKSNDTKVYYVKSSGIDNNVANKVQDVARTIKERQLNFTDLLNHGTMLSKVGASKDIFMPVGRSGEKGIDFDILAGQDVQLNTDLMEMLRSAYINATGTPSVIINYINEADYAKTLVMANAKFLGRAVSHQLDLNPSITELYQKLLRFTTSLPEEVIDELEVSLATPKALDTMNMTDLINNADQVVSFMVKVMTGENATPDEDDNKVKDLLYERISKEILPMLPWDVAEESFEEARLQLQELKASKPSEDDSSGV